MSDDIVLVNVPGPGDPSAVEIGGPSGSVFSVPTPQVDVALTGRVGALEAADAAQDARLAALELGGGGGEVDPEALQELIDTSIGVHVESPTPHPVYDEGPSLRLLFENGLV